MIYKQDYFGYVYIWYDTVRKMFCIGSHHGDVNDNYKTSQDRCARAIKKRPDTFRFRVLDYSVVNDIAITRNLEQKWLDFIPEEQLGKKYYNLKKSAIGIVNPSIEIRTKISNSLKVYYKKNPERIELIKENRKKQIFSKESQLKKSETCKSNGVGKWMKGRKISKSAIQKRLETNAKNVEPHAKPWKLIFENGDEQIITNLAKFKRHNQGLKFKFIRL